ncbi:hypothetical protein FAGAP_2967 [Fusarium agapanthi]|uniref:Ubiquitin-like protease family profile domain-containing protein n=1 Tax=Fusarium agapanthi TaxID=1803897 RepID=A0A9P5BI26_9HYPO|nr:hypothetical protein FAGAP_2967 [Fusarium agapanthi]
MSHHEIEDLPPPVSNDTIASALLKSPQTASKKPKTRKKTAYEKKKAKMLDDLRKTIGEGLWPSVSSTLQTGKSNATLMDMHTWLKHALKNNLNAKNVFGKNTEPQNKQVREGVIDVLGILDQSKDVAGLGTTIEVSTDTGTEMTVGSGAQHTAGADSGARTPSSSSPPPSQPSKTTPPGRPKKRVKKDDGARFDLATQPSSEDEEPRRKDRRVSAAEGAKNIHSRLKQDEQLNDDAIDIVNEVFDRTLLKNTRRTIVHPLYFEVDKKDRYPCKLKRLPKSGEPIYVPLHHESPEHWTSCVLFFKLDSELDPEFTSKVDSIHLDFYDSLENVSRAKKVEAFFTKWTKTNYPDCKFTFEQKKTAQQNDRTSCGVFVLETIRRLIESEDVTQTIEPIDAKKRFLDMVTSTDTNSSSSSTNLQIIEEITVLERKCETSPIVDGSPSTNQQPVDIQPSPVFITKIKNLCEPEGIPIAERLSTAITELKGITEEEERIKCKLTVAREEMVHRNTKMLGVDEVVAVVSEFITADDTTDDLPIGAATKDEPMPDDTPEMLIFCSAVKNAGSELVHKDRNLRKNKLAKAMEKVQREACESAESAEREVKRLAELETHLQEKKRRLDATIKVYEGLLYLASDGGGKQVDESLSTSDVTQSQ